MQTVELRRVRKLPDTDTFRDRIEFKSSSSGKTYVISRNRKTRQLSCSCPGWIFRRSCKHIKAFRCH